MDEAPAYVVGECGGYRCYCGTEFEGRWAQTAFVSHFIRAHGQPPTGEMERSAYYHCEQGGS